MFLKLKVFAVFCIIQTVNPLSNHSESTTLLDSDEKNPEITGPPIDIHMKLNRTMADMMKYFIPNITRGFKKGTLGTIGIIGGSMEYSGRPYFSAMAALKTGADLTYIFAINNAATAIKSHSPDIRVFPCLDSQDIKNCIKPLLKTLTALIIGPGLGKPNATVINNIKIILRIVIDEWLAPMPLIIDAGGFFIVYNFTDLLKEYPGQIYLTPNKKEFTDLVSILFNVDKKETEIEKYVRKLSLFFHHKILILLKGKHDIIAFANIVVTSLVKGSPKRTRGQGDMLTGCLAVFGTWIFQVTGKEFKPFTAEIVAAFSASTIVKLATKLAYKKHKQSTIGTDILDNMHAAYKMLFESENLPRI